MPKVGPMMHDANDSQKELKNSHGLNDLTIHFYNDIYLSKIQRLKQTWLIIYLNFKYG